MRHGDNIGKTYQNKSKDIYLTKNDNTKNLPNMSPSLISDDEATGDNLKIYDSISEKNYLGPSQYSDAVLPVEGFPIWK